MKISNPTARLGEDLATKYLQEHGFKILERNYRKTYGEIDIIALEKDVLCFIEVKTKTSENYGSPLDQIHYYKLRSLIKTAQYYKMTHKNLPVSLRIDAVAVYLSQNRPTKIELVRNISGF